jgi:hypothetical protein
MWIVRDSGILNCLATSNVDSVNNLLCTSLSQCSGFSCHRDIFEHQFEPTDDDVGVIPKWHGGELSIEQFLAGRIYDNPQGNEKVICVASSYKKLSELDLWSFINHRYRSGDFCLIDVPVNPLISYLLEIDPSAVNVWRIQSDIQAVLQHVRECEQYRLKLHNSCPDRAVVSVLELMLDYRRASRRLLSFLGLEYAADFPQADTVGCVFLAKMLELSAAIRSGCPDLRDIPELQQHYTDLP